MSDVRNGNSCSTLTFSASNEPKVSNNSIFAVGEKITPQSPNGDRSGNQILLWKYFLQGEKSKWNLSFCGREMCQPIFCGGWIDAYTNLLGRNTSQQQRFDAEWWWWRTGGGEIQKLEIPLAAAAAVGVEVAGPGGGCSEIKYFTLLPIPPSVLPMASCHYYPQHREATRRGSQTLGIQLL